LKKTSFKNIIIINVFLIYLIFSVIIYYMFYSYNFNTNKKNFKDKNRYSAKNALEMIEEEKQSLLKGAKIIASDDMIYQAFKNNIYITNILELKKEKIEMNTKEINAYHFIKLANTVKSKVYNSNRGAEEKGVELFNIEHKRVGVSYEFDSTFLEISSDEQINEVLKYKDFGGIEINSIDEKNGRFFLKSVAPIGKNSKYFSERPYGAVAVTGEINGELVENIKKRVNSEILIVKNGEILMSTIFNENERVKGKLVNSDFEMSDGKYIEKKIGENEYGITCYALKDYKNQTKGYICAADNLDFLKSINKNAIKSFIIFQIPATLILFIIIYISIGRLFKPIRDMVKSINIIKDGNYSVRLDKCGGAEIESLRRSINQMAEEIEKREKNLKDFNSELELSVNKRTVELVHKNAEMLKILTKLKRINAKNEEELEFAKRIHEQIVKFEFEKIDGYRMKVKNWSINGIGGDFVEVIDLRDGKKGIFFADISGHGVAAALMISAVKILVTLYFGEIKNPSEALYFLNDMMLRDFLPGVTISAVYLVVDEKTDKIMIAQAAQENSYFITEKEIIEVEGKGIILGVIENEEIEDKHNISYRDIEIKLKDGEKLFIYTDGLVENKNFTRETIIEILKNCKDKSADEIDEILNREVLERIGEDKKDDITYMILEKSC
jgi:serine phosphatase RsbU (regulator of sigma subunit)